MAHRLVFICNGTAPGRTRERLFETDSDEYDATSINAQPRTTCDRSLLSPMDSGETSYGFTPNDDYIFLEAAE